MQTPKAWLWAGDEHFLQRIVRVVGGVVRPVVVAARTGQDLPPLPGEVAVVFDSIAGAGPLAGLATGLAALAGRCDAAFVASCDHPLIQDTFVRRMIEQLGDEPGAIPSDGAETYPLMGVYRLSVASLVEQMLLESELRVRDFVARCAAAVVGAAELREADSQLASLLNVNTQQDYTEALAMLARQRS